MISKAFILLCCHHFCFLQSAQAALATGSKRAKLKSMPKLKGLLAFSPHNKQNVKRETC